jgi:hypothetical protein
MFSCWFSLIRYGQYCGPGPDESMWRLLKPVDDIDASCQQHDQAYGSCLGILSKQVGFDVPHVIHQIMPARGLFPSPLTNAIFSWTPEYLSCMHTADENFVNSLDGKIEMQACAVGITGLCLVPTKMLFQLALEVFRISVNSDVLI